MRNPKRTAFLSLGALILIAQLVPYPPAENPPIGVEVHAPAQVMSILRTSCYDCHSNETVWPWYSHVIPAKWFVRNHVVEGREHLNFSTWDSYSPERADHKLEEVMEYVEEERMPLESYVRLHGDAALDEDQRQIIVAWALGMRALHRDFLEPGEREAEAVEPPPADAGGDR
jgi:hypothetical protein